MNNLDPSLQYSPYFAGLEGKTPVQANELEDRIDSLPEASKDFLFDPDIADKLKTLLDQNNVPPQYVLALGKIVFLAVLGDVVIGSIEELLGKLGLEPTQAKNISSGITALLQPPTAERGKEVVGQTMQEMAPMSRPTETGPRTITGTGTPARNIIDLRNQQ